MLRALFIPPHRKVWKYKNGNASHTSENGWVQVAIQSIDERKLSRVLTTL